MHYLMSALCHKRTSAKSHFLILECKKKDRLEAVARRAFALYLRGSGEATLLRNFNNAKGPTLSESNAPALRRWAAKLLDCWLL